MLFARVVKGGQAGYLRCAPIPHPDLPPSRGWLPVFEVLVTRRPSAVFYGWANICGTFASFYWLGFATSGLPPDKKRLA